MGLNLNNLEDRTYTASEVRRIASKTAGDALRKSFKNMNKNIVFWREVHFPLCIAQFGAWSEIMMEDYGIINVKEVISSMYIAQRYMTDDKPVKMIEVHQYVPLPKHYKPQTRLEQVGFVVKHSRLVKGEMKERQGHYILTDKARKSVKTFSKKLKAYERKLGMNKINLKSGKWKHRAFNLWVELDHMFTEEKNFKIQKLEREIKELKNEI